jgi:predicted O-methyltransferase YrrM
MPERSDPHGRARDAAAPRTLRESDEVRGRDLRHAREPLASRVRSVVGAGVRSGVRGAAHAYQRSALLRAHPDGFDEAYALADAVPGWFYELAAAQFWGVIHERRPRVVLEIGSYLGRSVVFLAEAMRHAGIDDGELHSVDPHTGDRTHLEQLGQTTLPTLDLFRLFVSASGNASAVQVHVTTSADVLAAWEKPIDLAYIDGWHAYDVVVADVRGVGSRLSGQGLVCVDVASERQEVEAAALHAIGELELVPYGILAGKLWAGRSPTPPDCLRPALALQRRRARLPLIGG